MSFQSMVQRWASIGAALLIALAVAGTTLAGIQGTGFRRLAVFGTVEAGGGLRVNGVSYDASHARVTVNGRPAFVSQLRAGHIVSIDGSISADGSVAIADEVVLESDIRGEITSVDSALATFDVLGQTVQLTEDSILDSRITTMGGPRPGIWVKVSAFARADGTFQASRVDLDMLPVRSQVRGVVASLNRDHSSLRVGDLTVDYSVATIHGTLAEGAIVLARGVRVQPNGPLYASDVSVFTGVGQKGERGDIEGIITLFASAADFEVNGQPVRTHAKTHYVLHGQSLDTDLEVRVTGHFDASGVLVADKIQAAPPGAAHAAANAHNRGGRHKHRP